MTKKLCIMLLLFLSCWAYSGTCAAAEITADELTRLSAIFEQLSSNNKALLADLDASKTDLAQARQRLGQYQKDLAKLQADLLSLKDESATAKTELTTANALLKKASESFKAYDKEKQSEIRRLKLQNILVGAAAFYMGHSIK